MFFLCCFVLIWGNPIFFAKVVINFDKCKFLQKKVATFLQVTTFRSSGVQKFRSLGVLGV